jgi:hypothetical protein
VLEPLSGANNTPNAAPAAAPTKNVNNEFDFLPIVLLFIIY